VFGRGKKIRGKNSFPGKSFSMENDFPRKIIFHLYFLLFGIMENHFFGKLFSAVW